MNGIARPNCVSGNKLGLLQFRWTGQVHVLFQFLLYGPPWVVLLYLAVFFCEVIFLLNVWGGAAQEVGGG